MPLFPLALVLSFLSGALTDTVSPETSPETNVHRVPLSALQSSESMSYHAPASSSAPSHAIHRSHGSHGLYPSSSTSSSHRRFPAIAMLFPTTLTPYSNNASPASSIHLRDSHAAKYQSSEPAYENRRPAFSSQVPQVAARRPQSYSQSTKVQHHFSAYSHPPVEAVEKRPPEPTYDASGVHEAPPRFLFDRHPAPVAPEPERPRPAPAHDTYEQRDKQDYRGFKYSANDMKSSPFQPEKHEEPREHEPRPVRYSSLQNTEQLYGSPAPFRSGKQELRAEERPEFIRETPKQAEQIPYRYSRNNQDSRLEQTPSSEKATTFQGYPMSLFNAMNIPSAVLSSSTGGGSMSSRRRYNLVYIPVDVLKKLLTEAGYKKK